MYAIFSILILICCAVIDATSGDFGRTAIVFIVLLIVLGLGGYGIYKYITKEEVTAEEVMEATEAEANPALTLEEAEAPAEAPETEEGAE